MCISCPPIITKLFIFKNFNIFSITFYIYKAISLTGTNINAYGPLCELWKFNFGRVIKKFNNGNIYANVLPVPVGAIQS